ncbi:MAG: hypothetical protein ACXW30_02200 [Micavibrio sp.]
MGQLDAKFRKAARDIGSIIPGLDDPFWNFYRNIAQTTTPDIRIPVLFYDGETVVASADFRCLGSPYSLRNLALDQTIKSLKQKNPALQWNSVSASHGTKIPAAEIMDILRHDPLVQAAATPRRKLMDALMDFTETLRHLSADAADTQTLKTRYEQAQIQFVAAVATADSYVEWPQQSLRQRLTKILGLS